MGKKPEPKEITIIWNNGDITVGKSFQEIERQIRAMQWTTYETRATFRADMRKRARVWSGESPRICNSAKGFIRSLAEVGLFMLIESEEAGKEN